MKNKCRHIFFFLLALSQAGISQKAHIAFINAVCHKGDGEVLENCLLVIRNDKIETVTDATRIKLDHRSFDTVVDLTGLHIYPALINMNSVLGLHDAEAVRASVDFADVGKYNPHVRALVAYNTDNLIIPTVRSNGVLYTQVTPRGGIISGSSSLMALNGWNWEDAVVTADEGIHLNYPKFPPRLKVPDEKKAKEMLKEWMEEVQNLVTFFASAQSYCRETTVKERNIRFEALRPVFAGKANLYLHADHAKEILACLALAKKFSIGKPVIVGGKDAYLLTSQLRAARVPVILNRVNDLPDRTDDDVDLIFRLPYLLQKDSVLFCFQMEGDMEAMQSRNLPFNAGSAVAYGLSKEQALSAMTMNAVKILGVDHMLGTIDEGKAASFIISTGDILDMRTHRVVQAYLAGAELPLENRQTELYNKYKTKYGIR